MFNSMFQFFPITGEEENIQNNQKNIPKLGGTRQ